MREMIYQSSEDQIWRGPMSKACGLKLHCQNPEIFFLERFRPPSSSKHTNPNFMSVFADTIE